MKGKKGFQAGKSGNPAGRRPGSKNKTSEQIREKINSLVVANLSTLKKDFESLDPEKRLTILEKYLRYAIPPLSSLSVQAEITQRLERFSEEELEALADKIIQLTNQT